MKSKPRQPASRELSATRTLLLLLLFVVGNALLLSADSQSCVQAASIVDQADQVFLQQLMDRQFFELAKQHCEHQIATATNADTKAEWVLRLSSTLQQHAWFAETASRGELLNLAVEVITEFIHLHSPSPETQFRLRIQQARLLGHSIRMKLFIGQAGHLLGAYKQSKTQPSATASIADSMVANVKVIDQSLELTRSLLGKLEESRRDLDSQLARSIRDDARLQLAELECLKYQLLVLGNSRLAAESLQAAEESLNQAVRTIRDVQKLAFAKAVLAELSLCATRKDKFTVRVQAIGEANNADPILRAEFLTSRHLLADGEPTQAFTLLNNLPALTGLQRQQSEWLKLEALLGVHEIALTLNDASLLNETSQQFEKQLASSRKLLHGVFRDAAERTAIRFSLVAEVGIEIANLVEQVESLRAEGSSSDAMRLIAAAIKRLPATASVRAKAALQLRAGELHAAAAEWATAEEYLQSAFQLYQQGGMIPEQAAADLLRIYVAAQLLNANPGSIGLEEYVRSLENHLALFADQKTAAQARDWLLDVVELNDPVRAAKLSLDSLNTQEHPQTQIAILERMGQQLLKTTALPQTPAELTDMIREFAEHVLTMESDPERYPADDLLIIRLQSLEMQFHSATNEDLHWNELLAKLTPLQSQLKLQIEASAGSGDQQQLLQNRLHRCDLMHAVIAARSGIDANRRASIEAGILEIPNSELVAATKFLCSHYQHKPVRAGDTWLARMNQQLLKKLVDQPGLNPTFADRLQTLQKLIATSAITEEVELRDAAINSLLNAKQSTEQISQIAALLSDVSGNAPAGGGSSLGSFWRQVAKQQAQGSDLWLESQLQLAVAAVNAGKSDAAKRILGVVEAIYPGWGNSERQKKAEELLRRILQ